MFKSYLLSHNFYFYSKLKMNSYVFEVLLMFIFSILLNLIRTENTSSLYSRNLVSELIESDYNRFNSENTNYFIYFYSSSCIECSAVEVIFNHVAEMSNNLQISSKFVKFELPLDKNLSNKKVPSIYFVDNNQKKRQLFEGDVTFSSIIKFVKSKFFMQNQFLELNSLEDLTERNIRSNVLIFACTQNTFNKNRHTVDLIMSTADEKDLFHIFYFTNSTQIFDTYKINPSVLNLLSQVYDFKENFRGPVESILLDSSHNLNNVISIEKTLYLYSKKVYGEITEEEMKVIINKSEPALMLFYGKETNEEEMEKIYKFMTEISLKYRKDLQIFNSTQDNDATFMVTQVLRLKQDKLPILFLTSLDNEMKQLQKFKLEKVNLTKSTVEKFIIDWKQDRLDTFIQSEEAPEDPIDANGVYKIVGETFDKYLQQQDKDIILAVCSKIFKRCSKFFERFGRVAKKLANNPYVTFATVDPYLNEFSIHFSKFNDKMPELFLFPSDSNNLNIKIRFGIRIIYDGAYTTKEMTDFVLINSKSSLKVLKLDNQEEIYDEDDNFEIKTINEEDQSDLDFEELLKNVLDGEEEYTDEAIEEMKNYFSQSSSEAKSEILPNEINYIKKEDL